MLQGGLVLAIGLLSMAFFEGDGPPLSAAPAPTTTAASPGTTASPVTTVASPVTSATPDTTTATTATSTPVSVVSDAPPLAARFVVPDGEIESDAKQLASDIVYALTTYEAADEPTVRFSDVAGAAGAEVLAEAGEPLTHAGQWSRGEVVYPQMGGLMNGRASVMVVTRQTVGSGSDPDYSVVRTLDVRLLEGESGWEFDELASAGGAFGDVEALALAHAIASDPRIEMTDSARLDLLGGEISPALLELVADLAEFAPYGITVMATGHPYHVFETDRVSHHTIGRAIDIFRVDGRLVVDDRGDESTTKALVEWLMARPDVIQIGSPWDLDGPEENRSFVDVVHQDHIHVAVVGDD